MCVHARHRGNKRQVCVTIVARGCHECNPPHPQLDRLRVERLQLREGHPSFRLCIGQGEHEGDLGAVGVDGEDPIDKQIVGPLGGIPVGRRAGGRESGWVSGWVGRWVGGGGGGKVGGWVGGREGGWEGVGVGGWGGVRGWVGVGGGGGVSGWVSGWVGGYFSLVRDVGDVAGVEVLC